eukprot:TRINITY_DN1729_c0_g1_i6.p1 TRINITY_DN1729_c0_g1~~TRINITY_DN1729_c0_g1_i6.p1  ORF type:complete len:2769 (-),score=631.24 TRINITY_DN1729_c0_g1_i6:553-8859(-)
MKSVQKEQQHSSSSSARGEKRSSFSSGIANLLRIACNAQELNNSRIRALNKISQLLREEENDSNVRNSYERLFQTIDIAKERSPSMKTEFGDFLIELIVQRKEEVELFVNWISRRMDSQLDKDSLFIYLNILDQFLKTIPSSSIAPFISILIMKIHQLMEENQNFNSLELMIQIIVDISSKFESQFKNYFNDTIDILIGIKLDPSLPMDVSTLLSKTFLRFTPFWERDLSFPFDLLGKFIADVKKLASEKEVGTNRRIFEKKIIRFVSCFVSVATSIKTHFIKENSNFVPKLLDSFRLVNEKCSNNFCLMELNRCLGMICQWISPQEFSTYYSATLSMFINQTKSLPCHNLTKNILECNLEMIKRMGESLHIMSVSKLLTWLFDLRTISFTPITSLLLANFGSLVNRSIVGENTLQMTIHLILEESQILVSLLKLFKSAKNNEAEDYSNINLGKFRAGIPQKLWFVQSLDDVVHIISFNLGIMSQLKTNPASALIDKVLDFCVSNWISSSSFGFDLPCHLYSLIVVRLLCMEKGEKDLALSTIEQYIEYDFESEESSSTIIFLANWMMELIGSETNDCTQKRDYQKILNRTLFLCNHRQLQIRLKMTNLLKLMVSKNALSVPQLEQITNIVALSLNDVDSFIRKASLDLLSNIGSSVLFLVTDPVRSRFYQSQVTQFWKSELGKAVAHGNLLLFRSSHFQRIMNYFGQRQLEKDVSWLSSIFRLCYGSGEMNEKTINHSISSIGDLINNNEEICFVWACWECARYCILSRLRTPFGGAAQTFEAFERMFVHASSIADVIKSGMSSSNVGWKQLPTRLLLGFIDQLEKEMYRSFEPSSLSTSPNLVALEKNAALFFKANEKVTEDWLGKIRQSIITTSSLVNSASDTILHSQRRLKDLSQLLFLGKNDNSSKIIEDIEICLIELCKSLLIVRERDPLDGILKWSLTHPSLFQFSLWLNGVLLESKGMYEEAIEEYYSFLSHEKRESNELTPKSVEFITNQLTECIINLSDWERLSTWLDQLKKLQIKYSTSPEIRSSFYIQRDINYLQALSKYDNGEFNQSNLHLDLTPTPDSISQFNSLPSTRVHYSDMLILRALLNEKKENEEESSLRLLDLSKQMIMEPLQVVSSASLIEMHPYVIQLRCIDDLKRAYSAEPMNSSYLYNNNLSVHHHNEVGLWNKLLRIQKVVTEMESLSHKKTTVDRHENLIQSIIQLSRKQNNYRLAERLIASEEGSFGSVYQHIKIQYERGKKDEAISNLISFAQRSPPLNNQMLRRIHLKLSSWLQQDPNLLDVIQINQHLSSLHLSKDIFGMKSQHNQSYVENCIKEATLIDSLNPKSWLKYADWCWNQGHSSFSNSSSSNEAATNIQLTDFEKNRFYQILASEESVRNQETAILIEDKLLRNLISLSDNIVSNQMGLEEENKSTCPQNIFVDLKELLPEAKRETFEDLGEWRMSIRNRVTSYYQNAVSNYFHFLRIKSYDRQTRNGIEKKADSSIIASLRIFRYLVHFGNDSKALFEMNFNDNLPLEPWKDLIPQLFSRLGHSENFIDSQLNWLLSKISLNSPHLVIFPVLSSSTYQRTQIQPILSLLQQSNHQMVDEVKRTIEELNRITMLWEEQWVNLLQHNQYDFHSRLRTFKNESNRINGSTNLESFEKTKILNDQWNALMKPLLLSYEKLAKATILKSPETPHEQWFQSTYGEELRKAIDHLKLNLSEHSSPESANLPMRTISKEFHRFLKPMTVKLSEISPQLANMKLRYSPMPGIPSLQDSTLVTISSFEDSISILPTKTRPKKIQIIGSNGKRFGYLLKGNEDLHLDERIMQILTVTNRLLSQDKSCYARGLLSRKYAVIPLSYRSGLIQWVSGATPLYSIFKSHSRQSFNLQQIQQSNKTANPNKDPTNVNIQKEMRPTEMFSSKLAMMLKEMGIQSTIPRREWPIEVLKKVVKQLELETPRDLISKELWSNSNDALDWRHKTKLYSRSVAVMSIVGYVIGLGDRHLDNILLDNRTGQIIHIDYNICFEKGLELKVPERVPFRLTQNVIHAMGFTGTNGYFKEACKCTLQVLRDNKEILMTLLDAFVYNPLIDWTIDKVSDESRKKMELAISLNHFISRIEENKLSLEKHSNVYDYKLNALLSPIKKMLQTQKQKATLSRANEVQSIDQVIQQLKIEEEQNVSKMDSKVQQNSILLENKKKIMDSVEQIVQECFQYHENFKKTFELIFIERTKITGSKSSDYLIPFSHFSSLMNQSWTLVEEYRIILSLLPKEYISFNPFFQISQLLYRTNSLPTLDNFQLLRTFIHQERVPNNNEERVKLHEEILKALSIVQSSGRAELKQWSETNKSLLEGESSIISPSIPITFSSLTNLEYLSSRDSSIQHFVSKLLRLVEMDWCEEYSGGLHGHTVNISFPNGSRHILIAKIKNHLTIFLQMKSQIDSWFHSLPIEEQLNFAALNMEMDHILQVLEGILSFEYSRMYSKQVISTFLSLAPLIIQWENIIMEISCVATEIHSLERGLRQIISHKNQKISMYNQLINNTHNQNKELEKMEALFLKSQSEFLITKSQMLLAVQDDKEVWKDVISSLSSAEKVSEGILSAQHIHSSIKSLLSLRTEIEYKLTIFLDNLEKNNVEFNFAEESISELKKLASEVHQQVLLLSNTSSVFIKQMNSDDVEVNDDNKSEDEDISTASGDVSSLSQKDDQFNRRSLVSSVELIDKLKDEPNLPIRNAYADRILQRVDEKLNGKEKSKSSLMSVEDQVDWVIQQSTGKTCSFFSFKI